MESSSFSFLALSDVLVQALFLLTPNTRSIVASGSQYPSWSLQLMSTEWSLVFFLSWIINSKGNTFQTIDLQRHYAKCTPSIKLHILLWLYFVAYDDRQCPQAEADVICDITGMRDFCHLVFSQKTLGKRIRAAATARLSAFAFLKSYVNIWGLRHLLYLLISIYLSLSRLLFLKAVSGSSPASSSHQSCRRCSLIKASRLLAGADCSDATECQPALYDTRLSASCINAASGCQA